MKPNKLRTRFNTSVFAVLSTLAIFLPTPAQARKKDNKPRYSNVCEYILTRANLQNRVAEARRVADEFSTREYRYLGNHLGFSLSRTRELHDTTKRESRFVSVPSLPGDYQQSVTRQFWQANGKKYQFVNVGLKSLEAYSDRVNRTVFAQLLTHPDDDLIVYYDDSRLAVGKRLMKYRWGVHDAVLEIYKRKKPYLSENDFRTLIYLNKVSQNSDVLALLYPKTIVPAARGVSNRVALTIQISYFGDRHYFRPSVAEIVDPESMPNPKDLLPFEYRIPVDQLAAFRAAFYSRFPARYTCEMLRYASMDNQIPQSIRDRFLLTAFQKAERRGMKYVIAGADKYTERLYRRYGFQIYSPLPNGQIEEPEYVLYLRIGTPEYSEMIARLQRSAIIENQHKGRNIQ